MVRLQVEIVFASNITKLAEWAQVVNVQSSTILFLALPAMLTLVAVAGAGEASLGFPVGAIVRLPAAQPKRVIFSDKVFCLPNVLALSGAKANGTGIGRYALGSLAACFTVRFHAVLLRFSDALLTAILHRLPLFAMGTNGGFISLKDGSADRTGQFGDFFANYWRAFNATVVGFFGLAFCLFVSLATCSASELNRSASVNAGAFARAKWIAVLLDVMGTAVEGLAALKAGKRGHVQSFLTKDTLTRWSWGSLLSVADFSEQMISLLLSLLHFTIKADYRQLSKSAYTAIGLDFPQLDTGKGDEESRREIAKRLGLLALLELESTV